MKCTVVGDSGCGKSSLLRAYTFPNQAFQKSYIPTSIEKFKTKVSRKGNDISIEFWDTGGHLDSNSLSKAWEKTDCFLLCFNITAKESFDNIEVKWLREIQKSFPNAALYLVGCKSDLKEDKATIAKLKEKNQVPVSFKQAQDFAKKLSALGYLECSALSKTGVQEVFDEAITTIILRRSHLEEQEGDDDFDFLNKSNNNKSAQQETKLDLNNVSNSSNSSLQMSSPRPSTNGSTLIDSQGNQTTKEETKDNNNPSTTSVPSIPKEPVNINAILKKDGLKVEELLSEDNRLETLKEFRLRNKALITYLSKYDVLTQVVDLVANSEDYVTQISATEILSAEVPSIIDTFCMDGKPLWGRLFLFLQTHKPPLKQMQVALNFTRVAAFLIKNRNVEFIMYIKEQPDVLHLLVSHISSDCIVALLIAIIECQNSLTNFGIAADLPVSIPHLIGKLLEETNPKDDTLIGIKEFIEYISVKIPNPKILDQFQDSTLVDAVIKKSLSGDSTEMLNVLIKLIAICKNTNEYEVLKVPLLLDKLLQMNEEDPNVEKPLQKLYKILYQPCTSLPPSINTTNAVISPLGLFRLKCVQMIFALLKCNFLLVDSALIEHKIISRCIDLFFQFKWNNMLHCVVEKMALFVLESKQTYLCLYLLRDCRLLERIMQAQQHEEQEQSMRGDNERKIPRQGYMGHLYSIANAIAKSSKVHSAIFYLLEDIPNRGWKKFEVKLKVANKLVETPYTGYPPPKADKRSGFSLSAND